MREPRPRKAKEKAEVKRQQEKAKVKRKQEPTTSDEFNFSFEDDFFPVVTPPPVLDFSSYDSHPYFVAIDEINSAIRGMELGNSLHELLVKATAKAQKENLVEAKEQAVYEHVKITIQELIDRIDRTLIQPSPLTRDHFWNFRVPTAAFIQPAENPNQEKFKRARTDSADNKELFSEEVEDIGLLPDEFPAALFPDAPKFIYTTSFSKIIAKIEKPHRESQKRPESPSSGEETNSPTLEPVLKKAALMSDRALAVQLQFGLRQKSASVNNRKIKETSQVGKKNIR